MYTIIGKKTTPLAKSSKPCAFKEYGFPVSLKYLKYSASESNSC